MPLPWSPIATFLLVVGLLAVATPAAAQAPATITVELGGTSHFLTDASGSTQVALSGLRYNRRRRTFQGFARVSATGTEPLAAPLVLVIDPISAPAMTLANGDGVTSDADHDPLTYLWSFTSLPATSHIALDDPTLEAPSFVPDVAGLYVLQLIVSDGLSSSVADTTKVTAKEDHPPVITSSPNTAAKVGVAYRYPVVASDPDPGDAIPFSLDTAPSGMQIDGTTGQVSWTPTQPDDVGVQVRASDSHGLHATQSFTIHVVSPGSPPTLVPIGDRAVELGQTLQMQVFAIDPDAGDTLRYGLVAAPAGMTIGAADGRLRWQPTAVGDYPVMVGVTDSLGLQDRASFTVHVTHTGVPVVVNHAPVLDAIGDQQLLAGETLTLQVHATDPDGDPLTYSLINGPAGMAVDGSGTIQWQAATGSYDVAVEVQDPAGLSAATSFVVTAAASPGPTA